MQVKISYTAEVEDVPLEVSNILNTLDAQSHELQELINEVQTLLNSKEPVSLTKIKLKLMSDRLQKMFARLTDCQVILDGYEKVTNQTKQQQETNESQNR